MPRAGRWREILNTDEQRWDGSGEAANGTRIAQPVDGEEGAELVISIPPMAGVWLRFEPEATDS